MIVLRNRFHHTRQIFQLRKGKCSLPISTNRRLQSLRLLNMFLSRIQKRKHGALQPRTRRRRNTYRGIMGLPVLIPRETIRIRASRLTLIIRRRPRQVIGKVKNNGITTRLHLRHVRTKISFLRVKFLRKLRRRSDRLLQHNVFKYISTKSNGNTTTINRSRVLSILKLIIRAMSNYLRLFPTRVHRVRNTPKNPRHLTNLSIVQNEHHLLPVRLHLVLPIYLLHGNRRLIRVKLVQIFGNLPSRLQIRVRVYLMTRDLLRLLRLKKGMILQNLTRHLRLFFRENSTTVKGVFMSFFLYYIFL